MVYVSGKIPYDTKETFRSVCKLDFLAVLNGEVSRDNHLRGTQVGDRDIYFAQEESRCTDGNAGRLIRRQPLQRDPADFALIFCLVEVQVDRAFHFPASR